jgi:hypothetical protein
MLTINEERRVGLYVLTIQRQAWSMVMNMNRQSDGNKTPIQKQCTANWIPI